MKKLSFRFFSNAGTSASRGFTLIELLVVVSIIALLTSVVSVSVTGSKAHAEDVAKKSELNSIRTAVESYKLDHNGKAPIPVSGSGGGYGVTTVTDSDFRSSIQPLVTGGYLQTLPSQKGYFYFATSTDGQDDSVVVGTTLKTAAPTTAPSAGSCRPFANSGTGVLDPPRTPYLAQPGSPGYLMYHTFTWVFDTPTYCNDGIDNDHNGLIDYPADPGCVSIDDDGESSSVSGPAVYCSNNDANSDYCLCM